jgi:hypothetical protein
MMYWIPGDHYVRNLTQILANISPQIHVKTEQFWCQLAVLGFGTKSFQFCAFPEFSFPIFGPS